MPVPGLVEEGSHKRSKLNILESCDPSVLQSVHFTMQLLSYHTDCDINALKTMLNTLAEPDLTRSMIEEMKPEEQEVLAKLGSNNEYRDRDTHIQLFAIISKDRTRCCTIKARLNLSLRETIDRRNEILNHIARLNAVIDRRKNAAGRADAMPAPPQQQPHFSGASGMGTSLYATGTPFQPTAGLIPATTPALSTGYSQPQNQFSGQEQSQQQPQGIPSSHQNHQPFEERPDASRVSQENEFTDMLNE